MQMLSKLAIAGALVVNVAVAGTAAATTYTATYTGIVEGTDTDGLFSAPGTNLNGVAFTAVFTYNPALFGTAAQITNADTDQVSGGSFFGTTSPILSDSLTINGISLSVDPSQDSLALAATNINGLSGLVEEIEDTISGSMFVAGVAYTNPSVIADLAATQSYSGFLAFEQASGQAGVLDYGNDDLSLYSNTADISVPEPGGLVLMATAVGLLGFAARRCST
jgi:hypothetical protein